MFDKIKVLFLRQVLKKVVAAPAPASIPRTGERAEKLNCFWAKLDFKDKDQIDFVVDSVIDNGVEGRIWDGASYSSSCCMPDQWLNKTQLNATHYIGVNTFTYSDPMEFLTYKYFRIPNIEILLNHFLQYLYNSRTPEKTEQIKILKKLVKFTLEADAAVYDLRNNNKGIVSTGILQDIYGNRIFRHPEYLHAVARLNLTLASLIESGDIELTELRYRVKGKALSTISEYELENRRHKYRKSQNNLLLLLTAVLVLTSCFQAYLNWKGEVNLELPPPLQNRSGKNAHLVVSA